MIRSDRSSLQWNVSNYVTITITVSTSDTITSFILCFALNWRLIFTQKPLNAIIPSQTATEEYDLTSVQLKSETCVCEEGLDVLTEPVSVHHSGSPSSSVIVILMLLKQDLRRRAELLLTVGPAHRLQTPDLSNMGRIRVEDSRTAYCVLETVARYNIDTWPHYSVLIISENNIE